MGAINWKGCTMPRLARKLLNGEFFHITVKGIKGEYIFQENKDKNEYLKLLKEKSNINILAYCIMDNYAHILIKTENVDEMSKYMKKVNTSYALYYNKINMREGYVFKNRFFSQQIEDRKHLLSCIVYIHKNPLKADIVRKMENYKFSSYNDYFGINNRKLISSENILKLFDNQDIKDSLKKFNEYHLKDSLIEYEFDEKINYTEMIKAYKQIYSNKEIEKQLVYKFKLPIKKVAKLFNTSSYFIKKDIEN